MSANTSFKKVLIANRGAIACRIIRTLRRLGIQSVAVYSEADKHSLHVLQADEAICIGAAPAAESYLRQDALLAAARQCGAQAIHPGYGFLSENAQFAEACAAAGVVFVGPTPQQMRDFGLKHTARALAEQAGVPLLPGSGLVADLEHAVAEAQRIGYPLMLKSTAGGGGIGMQLCRSETELRDAFHSVERLARNNFSQGGMFLEKYVERARHIEVQIFGDGRGTVVALGERDCSLQRRNQKVVEETPAPGLSEAVRAQLMDSAVRLAQSVHYQSAGTVEFVYDIDTQEFYFLEVNTRLQVEHGVTEQVTGVDLVEWMLLVAANNPPALHEYRHQPQGHSIQVRLYAEDPARNFRPSSGLLTEVKFVGGIRIDSWIRTGTEVSAYYDPMLAKLISFAPTREQALHELQGALAQTQIHGIETNLEYLREVLADPVFVRGEQYTRYLGSKEFHSATIEVLQAGTQSCIQDYPGRVGYWDIGVPPSGPMDQFAFRLANRVLGNAEDAAALELTVTGPTLKFNVDTLIALTGAAMRAELDGESISFWRPIAVKRGSVLKLRGIEGDGQRTYLAVQGGFDAPQYMGSRATFTLGQFGGHGGRALRVGDVLRVARTALSARDCVAIPAALIPQYHSHWRIAVIYGPHGAPDFFTQKDIDSFFSTHWQVHYNSSRTGVRLIGPRPQWARSDGGEAGLHPSNIHDNAYAIGAVDFTGDMPVILGPDGPSLGGFVCPVTIVQAELWKMGQLKPGDTIEFHCIDYEQAVRLQQSMDHVIATVGAVREPPSVEFESRQGGSRTAPTTTPILFSQSLRENLPAVCYRQAGDAYLLVEYGEQVLDLELRFRVHVLMQALQQQAVPGVLELTPGIRSLQVHYDSLVISQHELLALLIKLEAQLPAVDDVEVDSRIVHLPLSCDDPATQLAIEKYMQSVRADAPWCPSNIEFIRRINGLDSIDDVYRIVFEASYLVMGLGDVYLGAPVATPLDPRHRLVTTKYNPARTWTPENAVGIGGAYLCVYGMEGPGGYQFVGRTIQMWNRYRQTQDFTDGKQWLLRFFDQIRFYPVSAPELLKMREDFIEGQFKLHIEPARLRLHDYREFLASNQESIAGFKTQQQAAFEAERQRWVQAGQLNVDAESNGATTTVMTSDIPADCIGIASPVTGSVWQLSAEVGARLSMDDELLVVEAMKMEIAVSVDEACELVELRVTKGRAVAAGEIVAVVRPGVAMTSPSGNDSMPSLVISELLPALRSQQVSLRDFYRQLLQRIDRAPDHHVWITRLSEAQVMGYVTALEARVSDALPLYGVPFVIKDNIDLAEIPTTAACPAFSYVPGASATVVQRLIDAGAIPLGKANMDQFATGLVGTRSPHGAGRNSFNPEYISGGSSSGSALAVALGYASFSLGTDTAGSGRVPAAFNNIVGLKPSCGRLSTTGLVPACRSIDCISIFALTAEDTASVLKVVEGYDSADPWSRPTQVSPRAGALQFDHFRVGVPKAEQLQFFGDDEYARLFEAAQRNVESLGGQLVELDFAPLLETARLLYEGPWVAERYAAIETLIEQSPQALHPVTREITLGARGRTAVQTFQAQYRLQALKRAAARVLAQAEVFLTPTAGTIYRIADVENDPIRLNSNLGYYTNFMNLLDLAAVAVPSGFRQDGLPFGVTLFAERDTDEALLILADRLQRSSVGTLGATPWPLPAQTFPQLLPGFMPIVVCGAHMQGLLLNTQLTSRGAYLLHHTRTAAQYRFYVLPGGPPQRPGLVRVDSGGTRIEVEVWAMPHSQWGTFIAGIPSPLCLGQVQLEAGEQVTGFLCEAHAAATARDISSFGSWRGYLASAH